MVVVCVPWIKPHIKFLPHFIEWYAGNKAKHHLELSWHMYQPLHRVQAWAVQEARSRGATHILFTEDDQWGFPIDGLEVLLEADTEVIGFPTSYKGPPFLPMCMRKKDPSVPLLTRIRNLIPVDQGGGPEVQTVDLLTWAFTLVRMDVWDRLPADPFAQWGECPTDSHFNEYCARAGIPRHVHFGFWIEHGDVPRHLHPFYRRMYESIAASRGYFTPESITADAAEGILDARRAADDMRWIEQDAIQQEALCVS